MMGTITTTEALREPIQAGFNELGGAPGPDDCYLALRGLRTMATRLARHQASGLRLAEWLQGRPEVQAVFHPALPGSPGHDLWRRDFTGSSGLFGFLLKPVSRPALAAMLDDLELFGMGFSWGGYESLLIPTDPRPIRTATPWTRDRPAHAHACRARAYRRSDRRSRGRLPPAQRGSVGRQGFLAPIRNSRLPLGPRIGLGVMPSTVQPMLVCRASPGQRRRPPRARPGRGPRRPCRRRPDPPRTAA